MSIAEIRGKLTPEEESAEDLLTSEVFSALELLGYPWLMRWLAVATAPLANGRPHLAGLLPETAQVDLAVLYWPWIPSRHGQVDGCEPDVVIKAGKQLIIVEMKYKSAKSGAGVYEQEVSPGQRSIKLADQLGREWFAGRAICEGKFLLPGIRDVEDWVVVYVTQGYCAPMKELDESLESICRISGTSRETVTGRLFWTNYQALFAALEEAKRETASTSTCEHEARIADHLSALLAYKGLVPFMGFKLDEEAIVSRTAAWRFEAEGRFLWPPTRDSRLAWEFHSGLFRTLSHDHSLEWRERDYDFFKGENRGPA